MYGVSRGCTIARPPSAQITEIRRGRGRDRPGKKEDDDSNLAQGSGRSRGIASLHSLARDTKQSRHGANAVTAAEAPNAATDRR